MSLILAALKNHAVSIPRKAALQDEHGALSYGELPGEIAGLAERLREHAPRAIAILADNGKAWALADLAAQAAGIPCIPLPLFFSAAQMAHVLKVAAIDLILTDQPGHLLAALPQDDLAAEPFYGTLHEVRLSPAAPAATLPAGTRKVTFTSGTTGEPKGVCLGQDTMETVAESLRLASAASRDDRHLCLLPLSTLLENIGGLYTPLLAGATVCLPGLAAVGLSGSSGLDAGRLLAALGDWQASTAIMVPQMLQAVVTAITLGGAPLPHGLRYLAVGGAPVAARLLETARALGLPVHEGYGLSECASVVAVNHPGEHRPGSVGKPLPHLRIAFADDGEILVRGLNWLGYLGEAGTSADRADVIATGDLGTLDADGFLFLTGRKKNMFVTSFGRNVAPEWVEGELAADPAIVQAAIFGEARPFNTAVIVRRPDTPPEAIEAALATANRRLPDYARVRAWIPAAEPFTAGNGLSTPNGRLRRAAILGQYAAQIEALYQP